MRGQVVLIVDNHYVACTIMVKDENERYVFLVKQKSEGYSFPVTSVKSNKTGLACIIESMKSMLAIEVENLELNELTNAVVNEYSVPLFVFTYEDETIESPNELLLEESQLSWLHGEKLTQTLEEWEITGVPQFLLI